MARRRHGSEAAIVLAHGCTVADLRDRPRQVRATAGPARIGAPVRVWRSSDPAAWPGSTWVSAIATIRPPARPTSASIASRKASPGSPGSTTTTSRRPTSTVLAGRPAGPERALTGHDREPGRDPLGPDRQVGDESQAVPDGRERGRPLDPLKGGRGRRPHPDRPGGHLGQRRSRREPGVRRDLARIGPEDRVRRELGDEEPRGEPAGHRPGRRPVGDLDERVGPQRQVEPVGEPGEVLGSAGWPDRGRPARRRSDRHDRLCRRAGRRPPPRSRGSPRSGGGPGMPGRRAVHGYGGRARAGRRRPPPGRPGTRGGPRRTPSCRVDG